MAIINGQTFRLQQEGEVRLGGSNVAVRCLEIRKDSVRLQVGAAGEQRELRLRN